MVESDIAQRGRNVTRRRRVDGPRIREMYLSELLSTPQIAEMLSLPRSRVRDSLLDAGVMLRTRAEGVRLAAGRLGGGMRGKKRKFTPEWCANISAGKIKHADLHAAGVSTKSDGYVEYTRGPNKNRGVHVAKIEGVIGRRIRLGEVVHHIDENPSNNELSNLALMTNSAHARLHRILEGLSGKSRERDEYGRFR